MTFKSMHTCIFVGMYVYTRGVRKKKQIIKIPTIHTLPPILTQIILTLYSITWKFITMFVITYKFIHWILNNIFYIRCSIRELHFTRASLCGFIDISADSTIWNILFLYSLQYNCPHKKISEILPLHSGIIVVLSNK